MARQAAPQSLLKQIHQILTAPIVEHHLQMFQPAHNHLGIHSALLPLWNESTLDYWGRPFSFLPSRVLIGAGIFGDTLLLNRTSLRAVCQLSLVHLARTLLPSCFVGRIHVEFRFDTR